SPSPNCGRAASRRLVGSAALTQTYSLQCRPAVVLQHNRHIGFVGSLPITLWGSKCAELLRPPPPLLQLPSLFRFATGRPSIRSSAPISWSARASTSRLSFQGLRTRPRLR